MSAGRRRAVAAEALVLLVLVAALAVLWRASHGVLAGPPLGSWKAAERWYLEVGPSSALLAVCRAAGVAFYAWLLVGTLLDLLALLLGGRASRALADLVAPRSLQRLVQGLAGLSLTAGLTVVVPSAGTLAGADEPGTATMRVLDGPGATSVPQPAPPARPAAVPVPAPVPPAPSVRAEPAVERVVVEAGECFWSISADAVTEALGRPATDREVAAHWRRLVEANRDRLVDPSNPDLLYPGQELVLPASDGQ